jgi:hypothetical protein
MNGVLAERINCGSKVRRNMRNALRVREFQVNFVTENLRGRLAGGIETVSLHGARFRLRSKNHLKADPMARHGRAARDEEGFRDARNVAAK